MQLPKTTACLAALTVATAGILTACGFPARNAAQPPAGPTMTVTASSTPAPAPPPPQTVYVQTPVPVPAAPAQRVPAAPASSQWYAQPGWIASQPWIAITPAPGQSSCQWLHAHGYSYAEAFAAWAQNGYTASWSATNDGYPCQKSYGMQH
jgi:hypothetical protein